MKTIKMETFIGTKVIKASTEMSRKEYCDYRGWELPKDENGEDRVYLVEYEPDVNSKSNHPNHEGYISMSPKAVFEKAYTPIKVLEDIQDFEPLQLYQKAVIYEAVELDKKIKKLDSFIESNPIFKTLDEAEQNRLIQQVRGMEYYFSILVERINNFK